MKYIIFVKLNLQELCARIFELFFAGYRLVAWATGPVLAGESCLFRN